MNRFADAVLPDAASCNKALNNVNPPAGTPLQRLTRAERAESGWSDEGEACGDLRRDCFVASTAQGALLVAARLLWQIRAISPSAAH